MYSEIQIIYADNVTQKEKRAASLSPPQPFHSRPEPVAKDQTETASSCGILGI